MEIIKKKKKQFEEINVSFLDHSYLGKLIFSLNTFYECTFVR